MIGSLLLVDFLVAKPQFATFLNELTSSFIVFSVSIVVVERFNGNLKGEPEKAASRGFMFKEVTQHEKGCTKHYTHGKDYKD